MINPFGRLKKCLHVSQWVLPCLRKVPTCGPWLTFSAGDVRVGIPRVPPFAQEVWVWIPEGTPFCQGSTHFAHVGTSPAEWGTHGNPVLRFPAQGCCHMDTCMVFFRSQTRVPDASICIFTLEIRCRLTCIRVSGVAILCIHRKDQDFYARQFLSLTRRLARRPQ